MACWSSSEWKASAMVAQVCRQLHIRQGLHTVAMTAEILQVRVCERLQKSTEKLTEHVNIER